jgi:predicted MFS family arabinose efflux permease
MLAVFAIAAPADWWAGLVAAALLAAFAARQATARTPLLAPRVLASRSVSGANLAQLLVIGAAMGFQVTVTLYLQRALGYGPAEAGLGLVPTAALIAAVSLGLSARLTARFGARPLLLAGLVMITAALALLTQLPAHAGYAARLLPALALFGLGAGLTLPAVTTLGMSGATDADAGVISGVFNTAQQVGAGLGAASTAVAVVMLRPRRGAGAAGGTSSGSSARQDEPPAEAGRPATARSADIVCT